MVIQLGICKENQLGTTPYVGRGMGVMRRIRQAGGYQLGVVAGVEHADL